MRLEQWDKAWSALLSAFILNPLESQILAELGWWYQQQGSAEQADICYKHADGLGEDQYDEAFKRGCACMNRAAEIHNNHMARPSDRRNALRSFRRAAIQFDNALNVFCRTRNFGRVLSYLAICMVNLKEYGRAIRCLEQELEMDHNPRFKVYYRMGVAYYGWEKPEQALACVEKSLAMEPGYEPAIELRNSLLGGE